MPSKLPYVTQPGSMLRILEKAKSAKTPDRFTQDFLATKLGFKGGTARQFIPLAKKLGLLGSDGTPSDLYKKFRNDGSSKAALGKALRKGYAEIFERNEYAHNLDKEKFKGLVVEITGLESNSRVVQLICQTFDVLKKIADFDSEVPQDTSDADVSDPADSNESSDGGLERSDFTMGLSYTINLVLPKTDDPAVFNAIFRSLKENLLKK